MHDFTHPTEPSQQFIIKRGEGVFTLEFNTSEQKKNAIVFLFFLRSAGPVIHFQEIQVTNMRRCWENFTFFFVVCEIGMFPDTYVEPG